MSTRSDKEWVGDILDRIARIKLAEITLAGAEENEDSWEGARIIFDAILYNLLIIGEAVKGLSHEIKERNSSVPWKNISGMRDVLTHEYFRVDVNIVRITLDSPLESLRKTCESESKRLG